MIHHHVTPLLSELSFVIDLVCQDLHLIPALCHGTTPLCPRTQNFDTMTRAIVRSGQEPHTPGGTEVTSVDLRTLRRHHDLWVWLLTVGYGSGRDVPVVGLFGATWGVAVVDFGHRRYHGAWDWGASYWPVSLGSHRDTMRLDGRVHVQVHAGCRRDASATLSVWFDVCPVVEVLDLFAGSIRWWFGLNRLGVVPSSGSVSLNIAQHATTHHASGLPAWEELLAVDGHGLLVWCCEHCGGTACPGRYTNTG